VPNTTVNALPYPAYGSGADGPAAFQALAEAVAPKLYRAEPLTSAQIAAIASPRTGQSVFNTTTGRTQFYNGTSFVDVAAGAYGHAALTLTLTNTAYTTVAFFVGTVFTESQFTLVGSNVNIFSVHAIVSSSAGQAQVLIAGGGFGAPSDSTTTVIVNPTNGHVARNFRLDPDGFVRFEIQLGNTNGAGTAYNYVVNWRAR
jgi:hypothetical protein